MLRKNTIRTGEECEHMTQSGLKLLVSHLATVMFVSIYSVVIGGEVIYRERVVDVQGNLSCKEWVVLVPFSANGYKTRHGSVQFV